MVKQLAFFVHHPLLLLYVDVYLSLWMAGSKLQFVASLDFFLMLGFRLIMIVVCCAAAAGDKTRSLTSNFFFLMKAADPSMMAGSKVVRNVEKECLK